MILLLCRLFLQWPKVTTGDCWTPVSTRWRPAQRATSPPPAPASLCTTTTPPSVTSTSPRCPSRIKDSLAQEEKIPKDPHLSLHQLRFRKLRTSTKAINQRRAAATKKTKRVWWWWRILRLKFSSCHVVLFLFLSGYLSESESWKPRVFSAVMNSFIFCYGAAEPLRKEFVVTVKRRPFYLMFLSSTALMWRAKLTRNLGFLQILCVSKAWYVIPFCGRSGRVWSLFIAKRSLRWY